ncbi:hypothetical protein PBT90_01800 [Algoriphagus halophytocola]|uniref:DUF4221 domain-containing protein n=1 Tax=Algoriphagus halophytocola TaxID=2991499 RepID=A0ABY6MEY4_9BACT|nr:MULTISPECIES: hypothetical protein [unclassified Algoriphagus]UZD22188.1 hypothetical protein OM944_16125 [Algoriphagus sp. TR-M5]WBL43439.1 hypothetical protein PBT90_01800 [Algoriphagus sp. TR-M9]
MHKSHFLILIALFAAIIFSCSEKESTSAPSSPIQELQFEVVDSMKVDLLEQISVLDYHTEKDLYLMKNPKEGDVYLVNGKGEILEKHELGGEGPNQIQHFYEGRFYGGSGYVFKELSAEMAYHIYDADFNKITKTRGTIKELSFLSINSNKQSFSVYEDNGAYKLIGEEPNSYSRDEINPDKIGAGFYNQVNTGFVFDLAEDSIYYFNTYPEDWTFKKEQKWIGANYPNLSFDPATKTLVSLPMMGDQLGIYRLEGNAAVYQKTVGLIHPDREEYVATKETNSIIYPGFTDVKSFGQYHILTFYTPMPEDVFNGFRAKSEEYFRDPEYRDAMTKYRKPRFIVLKGDQQIGILNELPVKGAVNLGLPDGTLLIKAADGEVERDYNLFYKVRLIEE